MQNHQHLRRRRRRRIEEVQYDYYYGDDDDTTSSPSTSAPTTTPTTGSTTNNYGASYDDTSSWLTRGEKVGATIGLITLLSIGFYALLMSIKISRRRPGKRKHNASDWKICLSGSKNNNINADNDDDNETYTLAADDGGSVVSIKAFIQSKMKTTARSIELTKSIRARSNTVPLSSSSPSNGEVDDVRNTVEINKKNKKKKIKKNKKTARAPVVSRIQQQNNERKKKLVVIPWIQHQQQTDLTSSTASESHQSPTDTVVTTPMYTGFPTSSSVQTDITTDTGIIPPNDTTTIATPATYNTSQYTNTTSSSAYMTNKEEWDNNDEIYDINTRYQQQLLNKNNRKVKDDPSSKSRPFDEESGVPGGGDNDNSSSSNSSGYDVFAGLFEKKNSTKKDGRHEEQQECGDGYQELEDDSVFDGCD